MSAVLAAASQPVHRPLVDRTFLQDPYPTYRMLQQAGPIHWSDEFFEGGWLLTRYDDVDWLLRDPRFSARRTGGWVKANEDERGELSGFQRLFARAMLFLDGPDHQRLRDVLAAGFTPALLRALVPRIEQWVTQLLDTVDAKPGFDFMAALARPLPTRVIASLIGIPAIDQRDFYDWCDDLASFIGAPRAAPELAHRAQQALLAMSAFFAALVRKQHREPGSHLLGCLIDAEAAGTVKGNAELLAQCAMLLFAGHETTRNLLGNGLLTMLSSRDEWERLRRQPHLISSAVRECLRYDSPVQYTGRRVAHDMVLHGIRLRRGDLVIGLIGAANRDPARFTAPDRFDVARREVSHLSFGRGPHACIGAALAMMEAECVLRQLLERWPELELESTAPAWNGNAVYRGLVELRVRCGS